MSISLRSRRKRTESLLKSRSDVEPPPVYGYKQAIGTVVAMVLHVPFSACGICRVNRCALAGALLFLAGVGFATAASTAFEFQPPPPSLKSHSGRFSVSGVGNVTNLVLLRWAERTADKVEKLTGITQPFDDRIVGMIVCRDSDVESGRVVVTGTMTGGRFVQRFAIHNPDRVDHEDVTGALCKLLLDGCILHAAGSTPRHGGGIRWRAVPGALGTPDWLSVGLAQNLDSQLRATNSLIAFDLWQEGKLPTLRETLATRADECREDEDTPAGREGEKTGAQVSPMRRNRSSCGSLVGWLLSLPGKADCLERIIERLGAGEPVTVEWLSTGIPGCASIADLADKRDAWILREKRLIRRPGVVTLRLMNQLRAELLLSSDFSGTPWEGEPVQKLTMADLVGKRNEKWISAAARSRSASLRTLSVGRGGEFQHVVDLYCRFLEAVILGGRPGRLKSFLQEAEDARKALAEKVGKETL